MSGTGLELSCDELEKMMVNGKVEIIDVREPQELEKGKIVGSVNIPVGDVKEAFSLDPASYRSKFGFEKPGLEAPLVFHCQIGKRGANATAIAQALGYTKAQNLRGGFNEWAGHAKK